MDPQDWIGVAAAGIALGHIVVDVIRWQLERVEKNAEADRRRPKVHVRSALARSTDAPDIHLVLHVINNGHVDVVDPSASLVIEYPQPEVRRSDLLEQPHVQETGAQLGLNPTGTWRDVLRPNQSQEFYLPPNFNPQIKEAITRGAAIFAIVFSGERALARVDGEPFRRELESLARWHAGAATE